ncbi:MAG TPA: hypothetical protein VFG45_02515 [Candidatus Nitrosocosmicus sp.]|nr:hypothetical protein [Candidatus Nitrosocosmicus sp.]
MVKKLGVFFAVLLTVLLLSSTHVNNSIVAFAQNITTPANPSNITAVNSTSNTASPTSPDKVSIEPAKMTTKLDGGIKITSPDKGDLVPLNSNKSLVINGVSKDNATSDCDVTIILNNAKPYQNVQPTGLGGSNDYSSWKYTLSSNYTSINEGNNKITSKIYCANLGGQSSQAYYSVNVTATNFTQAQLSNYEMMLNSPMNSTNNSTMGGNTTLTTQVQPIAQVQQFNEDTGNGPICCKTTSALTGVDNSFGGSSGSSSSNSNDDDDDDNNDDDNTSRSSNDDDDDSNDSSRCPDGFHRSPDGDCERVTDTSGMERCPDGFHRSPDGDCERVNNDDDNDNTSRSSSNDDDDDDNDSFDFSNRVDDFDFGFDFDNGGSDDDNGGSDDDFGSSNSGIGDIFDNVEDTMKSAGIDFSFS